MTAWLFFEDRQTELIERLAAEAHAEILAMAEHARRSIGQRTRLDHFRRRLGKQGEAK